MAFQQLWWSLNICIKFLSGFSLFFGPTGAGWAHAGISFRASVNHCLRVKAKYLSRRGEKSVCQIFVWSASVTAMMDKVRTVLKAFAHVNIILKLSVSMEEIYLLQHPPGASLGRWGDALEAGVMALPWLWVLPSLMSLGDLLNQQWVSRYLHSQGQVRCQGLQLLEVPLSVFYLGFNLLISHRCSGGKCQGKWRLEEQHSSGRNNFSHQIFFLGRSKK